jgi:hypothetical protein
MSYPAEIKRYAAQHQKNPAPINKWRPVLYGTPLHNSNELYYAAVTLIPDTSASTLQSPVATNCLAEFLWRLPFADAALNNPFL